MGEKGIREVREGLVEVKGEVDGGELGEEIGERG